MAPKKVTLPPAQPWKTMVAFALAAIFLLFASSVRAALQFDVFLSYDDIVPERSWFPITCELNNDGPAFNAVIEVSAAGLNGAPIRRAPVDLPTNTRKRIFLPVFSSGNSWEVRLVDEGGHVLATQTVSSGFKPALRGFPIVAGLARNISGLPVFPDVSTRQQQSAKFNCARLQTALFPDNPLALEGINMLYLNSSKALELTVPQVNALVAWVEDGGHLVVGVEQVTDINGTPWLRNLLPCDLTSTKDAPVGAILNAWLQGAPPPAAMPERVHRPRPNTFPGSYFTIGRANAQNLDRVIVMLGPDGVTYRTNSAAPRANGARKAPQFWLSNDNGTYSHFTAAGFSNFLELRGIAMLSANTNQPHAQAGAAGSTEFDTAALQVATATPRDAKILIGDASAPLAIQGAHGRGLITALTFSPEREPFLSWEGRPRFWMRLAGIPQSMFDQQPSDYAGSMGGRLGSDALFGAMIDSKQVHKLPLGWLLALLGAYLVVIGPLDQYWLKKINRQMLTWITFPCYVLFFSGLIYWIGFHLRNGELEWNELNMVDILDSGDGAVFRGQTYISIYSPVNGHYKLASDQPFATLRGEFAGNYGLQENSRASVVQRGNSFVAEASVPVWTSQLFVSDWLQRGPAPVSLSVERSNAAWTVRIDNNLDHKIGPLRLAVEGRIYELGDLDANQSRTNLLERAQGEPLDSFLSPYANAFRAAIQQRQSNFGDNGDPIPDVAAGATAASFLSTLNQSGNAYEDYGAPAGLDLSRFVRAGYAVLLAWDDDHSLTDRIDQFKANRTHRRSLLRMVEPLPPPNS
jgi:hypothetical protein